MINIKRSGGSNARTRNQLVARIPMPEVYAINPNVKVQYKQNWSERRELAEDRFAEEKYAILKFMPSAPLYPVHPGTLRMPITLQ